MSVAVDDLKTQWDGTIKDLRKLCRIQTDQLKKASDDVAKWQAATFERLDRPRSGRGSLGFSALHDLCINTNCKTFEFATDSDWNGKLQDIIEKPGVSIAEQIARQRAVTMLTKDFVAAMTPRVRDLIHSLVDPARSPVQTPPELCKATSVVASVYDNTPDIKKTTHELLASHVLMQCIDDVGVALFTVVQYLGYVVTLIAVTPTNTDTAVWGYRRHRVHAKSQHIQSALRKCSEYLNLAGYPVADNVKDVIYGGGTLEGHVGTDGRYYVGHLDGMFPHYPPPRGQPLSKENTVQLRPEFVQKYQEPLSPGAFHFHGTQDSRKRNTGVRTATAVLCQVVVPTVAAGLVANPPMKCSDVTSVVHAGGVNISLLALVLHCIPLSAGDVRALVMTEMVARACRNALWQIMRTDACGDEDEARSIISQFVCNICDPVEFPKLWKSVLEDRLKGKYIGYGSAGPAITPDQVKIQPLFDRIAELCGLTFSFGVTVHGSSPFHFSVEKADVKVKSLPRWGFHICPEVLNAYLSGEAEGGEATFKALMLRHGEAGSLPAIRALHMNRFMVQCLWHSPDGKLRFQTLTKAESYCKRVVMQREKTDSGDSYAYTDELMLLANLYVSTKSFAPAVAVLEKVTSIRQRLLGSAPETAHALVMSALAYSGNRQHSNALKCLVSALDMLTETCSNTDPRVMATLSRIASLYDDRGQYSDAEPFYARLLEVSKAYYGASHIKVTTVLNNLAVNFYHQEKYEQAEELYKEDLRITEELLGADHTSVASTLNNLACLYDLMEKYDLSEPLYKRDIEISTKTLGGNHPDVATSLNNLAASYAKRRMFHDAEVMYRKSLQIRQEHFKGQDHVDLADSLNNLGTFLRVQGNLNGAKSYFEQALAMYQKTLGMEHHLLRKCLENLQNLCEEMDDPEEAEQYSEHLLELVRGDQLVSSPIPQLKKSNSFIQAPFTS